MHEHYGESIDIVTALLLYINAQFMHMCYSCKRVHTFKC